MPTPAIARGGLFVGMTIEVGMTTDSGMTNGVGPSVACNAAGRQTPSQRVYMRESSRQVVWFLSCQWVM